jgi:site-specific DNA-methyltransferase (adenine-specific)
MRELPENSVDSIVTDPPYELGFMGKSWDNTGIANNPEMWREALRVLKPGGHMLAFSGTRTYHRMAVAIEDAGFEVRDMIEWVYGSGFPKSLNIGKAVDKLQGNEREVLGEKETKDFSHHKGSMMGKETTPDDKTQTTTITETKGTSEWEGWGTALKPAHEPICMARKPLAEKTVALNVLKYGTGGINIDESRVDVADSEKESFAKEWDRFQSGSQEGTVGYVKQDGEYDLNQNRPQGRFPANLIHDNSEEVRECFPESKGGAFPKTHGSSGFVSPEAKESRLEMNDSGNASRFFKSIIYQAKSSKRDRNSGLDSTLTVKYNSGICKEENMVAVQLLQRVISEQELVSFNIDESGENIMAQCHKDSLFTTLTKTSKIIELKTLHSLMRSLTSEYIAVANSEMESGGNPVESVESLRRWLLDITHGKMESAHGVSLVALQMLSLINVEENWKPMTNIHSTVKPIALMSYLIKMVTPEGGNVLDPFMGSGSTGVAAKENGYGFIGIDMTPEYVEIAKARLEATDKTHT